MALKITESISLPNDAVTPEVDGYRVEVLIQRFAEKTMFGVGAKQCWEWQGYKRNGYGSISMHDHPAYMHVLAYRILRGKIPESLFVLHECDNRACWRPDHLFTGTQAENLADMRRKKRHSDPPKHFGLANFNARLTDDQVQDIRNRGISNQHETAAEFGVSQSTVWRIVHGVTRNTGAAS